MSLCHQSSRASRLQRIVLRANVALAVLLSVSSPW